MISNTEGGLYRPIFKDVRTAVRPARCAIFIDVTDRFWRDTCLRVIEWTTAIWGGWYSCVIPTDGQVIAEPFWQLLEAFDPDYLFVYDKTLIDLQIASPAEAEQLVISRVAALMTQYGIEDADNLRRQITSKTNALVQPFRLSATLYTELLARLNPFSATAGDIQRPITARPLNSPFSLTYVGDLIDYLLEPVRIHDIHVRGSALVQLMTHSLAGKMWSELGSNLYGEKVQPAPVDLNPPDSAVSFIQRLVADDSAAHAHMPARISLLNCTFYPEGNSNPALTNPIIVVGDTVEDFCFFHSLHRLRWGVYWHPYSNLTAEDGEERWLCHQVLNEARRASLHGNINFISISLSTNQLAAQITDEDMPNEIILPNGKSCQYQIIDPLVSKHFVGYIRRLYGRDNAGRFEKQQFIQGDCVSQIDTPKPKHFSHVPSEEMNWITDVEVAGYRLPQRAEFGPATIVQYNYGTYETRVTRTGFSYFCPYIMSGWGDVDAILAKPTLHLLTAEEVFTYVFAKANHHIQLSDKGNYHMECHRKFGTLADLGRFWADGTNRSVLDAFFYKGKNEMGKGRRIGDRRYLDFEDFEKILISSELSVEGEGGTPSPTVDDIYLAKVRKTAAALVAYLLERQVLHRGLIFKCEVCRQQGWYSITDVSESFRCSRCRTVQRYTTHHWHPTHEPMWFYQLDEILFEAYRNDCHVSTLALAAIERHHTPGSFLYMPETELLPERGAKQQEMEIDFCCVVDGRLLIGEAKKADQLEQQDAKEKSTLERYRDLVQKVRASSVVLATFEERWDSRTEANARHIIGDERLRLLGRKDLLALSS